MSVVKISSPRTIPEAGLEQLAQLAVTLSRRLTRVMLDEMPAAIAEALLEISAATRAEGCQLLEYSEAGSLTRAHLPTRSAITPGVRQPALDASFVESVARGELVATETTMAVPASLGGRVICALVIDCGRVPRRWPPALVERLQLLTEIFGACSVAATRARCAPTSP
jgi:hypothetical protein